MSLEEIREHRIKKLEQLRAAGMDPFPLDCSRELSISELTERFSELKTDQRSQTIVGRVMSLRPQGRISFAHIEDPDARFQILLRTNEELDSQSFKLWQESVDIGDIVEVTGLPITTKRGEPSLEVHSWQMLAKSLRPLPEKWHGLKDAEARYRQRHLDLLMNPELKELFQQKASFWDTIRDFLKTRDFLEVETPTLEHTTGGAEAEPFRTHHNDFDMDLYLRISVGELWQKRLMVAGFERTFEIGRVYRNEGSSPDHLQEFTNMECYAAYLNFTDGQALVQELYRSIAERVFGRTKFNTRGYTFDLADDWQSLDYIETIKQMTGLDVLSADRAVLKQKLDDLHITYEGDNRERLIDSLWKYCRRQIGGPAFLINHPKLVAPLSKTHPENEQLTSTFQIILAGSEVGRGHAELNDPLDQRRRFTDQQALLQAGDEEAMMPDWEYVETMEHAMPPNFGFGVGERLFAILVDKPVRETTLFPLLKPKDKRQTDPDLTEDL